MEIIVENLVKCYHRKEKEHTALDGIQLKAGSQMLAVIGPGGSGKTTLLGVLGGLCQPTSGRILFDGVEITAMDRTEAAVYRRRKIGIVFSRNQFIRNMNLYDNIVFPQRLDGVAIDYEYVDQIVRLLGLEDKAYAFPHQLSQGEQQRGAVARALAGKPSLVLADELTRPLDSKTGRYVTGLLKMTCRELEQTVILATRHESLAEMAQRKVCLKDGKIYEIPERSYV